MSQLPEDDFVFTFTPLEVQVLWAALQLVPLPRKDTEAVVQKIAGEVQKRNKVVSDAADSPTDNSG